MNVALFLDGDCYNQDAIFDDSPGNWLNLDRICRLWVNLRDYLAARGVNLHTHDVYPGFAGIDKAIFHGLYTPNNQYLEQLNQMGVDCYYVAYEPPVIHDVNDRDILKTLAPKFKKILTWQDDLIDGRKFFRLYEGKVAPDMPDMTGFKVIPFDQRYFMMMINSYRYANSDSYRELYSERFRAARFFEEADDGFHVYGRGLNNPEKVKARWGHKPHVHFHSYVGQPPRRSEVVCRYKFNLCFENCSGVYGYFSEKILWTFYAATVPVYWGAPNPTDHIPAETFIDIRAFKDYPDLHRYLRSVDEKRFNKYLEAIQAYLASPRYEEQFGPRAWARRIHEMILDDPDETGTNESVPRNAPRVEIVPSPRPKVSVLIPTRNRAALLTRSLECLTRQDYPELEVVVVDDASEDDTQAVARQFEGRLAELVLSRNETCLGPVTNFLRAAELATGDYVLNFSDDDLLADGAIQAYVAPLAEADYDLIYADLSVIDSEERETAQWRYEAYPAKEKLLRQLLDRGGNVIPEVMLIKRSIYDQTYGQMYTRRFITPFFLGRLNHLKMRHINQTLFRYRVHAQSTFSDASGLIIRNKGVVNFMNLIMFQNPPQSIFDTPGAVGIEGKIVGAVTQYVSRLLAQADRFTQGTFYTGCSYGPTDHLDAIFLESAAHWLRMAHRFKVNSRELAGLTTQVNQRFSPRNYDPVAVNRLPEAYRQLPWFAYRPPVSPRFVALDLVTVGRDPALAWETRTLETVGETRVELTNTVVAEAAGLKERLEAGPVQVVNVLSPKDLEDVLATLAGAGRYFLTVINATGHSPEKNYPLARIVPMDKTLLTDFPAYLTALKEPLVPV